MPHLLWNLLLTISLATCSSSTNESQLAAIQVDTLRTHDGGSIQMSSQTRERLVAEDSLWAEALRIHYDAIVMDGHIDTPSQMVDAGYQFGLRHQPQRASHHVDLPRMFEGGLDAPFFSIYVSSRLGEGEEATARAFELITETKRQVVLDSTRAGMATSYEDVINLTTSGKKAILLGLEGGHATQASESTLRQLFDAGIRYITLTHTGTHSWADASQTPPRHGGLSDRGRELVREMNRLGVLIDLSHVSDSTFYDAIEMSQAPVIASHSSARNLVDNVRNIDDRMLRALAANGGVVMINFFDHVVNSALTDDVMREVYARLDQEHQGNLLQLWSMISRVKRARGLPDGTLHDVVDHIEHLIEIAGIDHVGLGSDFDGVSSLPDGMEDVTRLPWITYELLRRGYSEPDIRKVLGGNTLRVLSEAERVASELQMSE